MKKNESAKYNNILLAAAGLFAKQGYKKTTIDEIVELAGISKGLFYHYFSNKRELYCCLYKSYVQILSNNIREKIDLTETDFLERFRQIAHIRIDFIIKYPALWSFLYSSYFEEHPDVAVFVKKSNERLLKESYDYSAAHIDWSKLKECLSPDKAIEMIIWLAEGCVKKIESNPMSGPKMYAQFDDYLECLKSGIYRGA